MAAGLADLGVRPKQRVLLIMRNRSEFHYADVGVLLAGATPISIYNSSSPEQTAYLAGHSSDELTPTMKLKRRGVLAKYADDIESLYA